MGHYLKLVNVVGKVATHNRNIYPAIVMYIDNLVIPVSNVSLVAHKQSSTGRSLDTNHTTRQRPDPLRPRKGYGVGRRISCSHVKCEEKPQ